MAELKQPPRGTFANPLLAMLRFDMIGSWRPSPGDPTLAGWLTVVAYWTTAFLCWRAQTDRSEMPWWRLATLVMILLGLNKQMDLQSLLTGIARQQAMAAHWYGQRRLVQREFIYALGGLAILGAMVSGWMVRRKSTGLRVCVVGLIALGAFVVIRAASFHHMDTFLGTQWIGLRANVVLELTAISIVAFGAWHRRNRSGGRHPADRTRRRRE